MGKNIILRHALAYAVPVAQIELCPCIALFSKQTEFFRGGGIITCLVSLVGFIKILRRGAGSLC